MKGIEVLNRFLLLVAIGIILIPDMACAQLLDLRHARLPNGLTYYIVKDDTDAGQVNFYLYQNVGAVVEEDDQKGLAHFLEHMAFNATEHFPGGVMRFLRGKGIYTFNAHTGINETLFQINNIATSDKILSDSVLMILKDWCNGVSFLPTDVEKERKIVIEEWRQSRSVDKRLTDATAPVLYNGTEYATHNVIGNEQVLGQFKAKDIRRFYQTWYKPEFQCVVITGDIDPAAYESEVVRLFGGIPVSKSPRKRENIVIPDNDVPLYYRFIDKENLTNSFGFYQRCHVAVDSAKDAVAEQLNTMIFPKLASRRLSALRNAGQEEYIAASMDYAPWIRSYNQNAWDVVPYKGKELQALEQILNMRETMRRNGFTEAEFEDVKWEIYKELKSLLESEHLGTPDNLMDVVKQNYLYGTPLKPFRDQLNESAEKLMEMEASDFNQWLRSWMDDKNLAFITYSSRVEDMNISQEQFDAALAKAKISPDISFAQPIKIEKLIDYSVTPGNIVSTKEVEGLGVKEWILSNGARILYKYLPEAGEKVYFAGSAMGGRSLVSSEDLPSYTAMQALIMESGLYKYNRNQLYQWIKDKNIDLSLSITDYTDGIGGNVSLNHAEDFFSYLHLVLTQQRFDKQVFRKFVERKKYLYQSRSLVGMAAVQDSIKDLLYPPSAINPKEDVAFYDRMNGADLQRLFDDRFGNAADFSFCLIGAIPEEEVKQLVKQYIASLPGIPASSPRKYRQRDISSPAREIVREFHADLEGDIGEIEISFSNNKELSEKERAALPLLKELLQYRFFEELREKEGGVYSIAVNAAYTHVPQPGETLQIHFTTEREKADKLKMRAYEIIEEISRNSIADDDFKKVYIPMAIQEKQQEVAGLDNEETNPGFWLVVLNAYVEESKLPDTGDKQVAEDDAFSQLTRADVAAVVRKILDGAKKRDITVKSIPVENRDWEH